MMVKLPVITVSWVLLVLQVLGDEARQPRQDCAYLCEQVDSGYAGICCGKLRKYEDKNFFLQ